MYIHIHKVYTHMHIIYIYIYVCIHISIVMSITRSARRASRAGTRGRRTRGRGVQRTVVFAKGNCQRTVTRPVDGYWNCPLDFQRHFPIGNSLG